VGARFLAVVAIAVLLGGGLLLAALVPGLGLIALLGAVVIAVLIGFGAFSATQRHEPQTPELLGPGGPDDTRGRGA
jgi:hypothetical protein